MSAAPSFKFEKRSNALRSEYKSRGGFAIIPKEILQKKWPAARIRIFGYLAACSDDALIFYWTLENDLGISRSTVVGEINWLVRHGYLSIRKVSIKGPDGWREAHTWDLLASSSWRDRAESGARARIQKTGHEPELPENQNADAASDCSDLSQSPAFRKPDTLENRRKSKSKTQGGKKSGGNRIAPREQASGGVTRIRQKITLESLDAEMSAAIDGRAMGCREREKFLRSELIQKFSREQIQMVMQWRSGPKANFFIREFGEKYWRAASDAQRQLYWSNLRSVDYWAQLIEIAENDLQGAALLSADQHSSAPDSGAQGGDLPHLPADDFPLSAEFLPALSDLPMPSADDENASKQAWLKAISQQSLPF